jgi:hypothetical protein
MLTFKKSEKKFKSLAILGVVFLDDDAAVHVGEAKVLEPALLMLLLISEADHRNQGQSVLNYFS